jgi:ribosomal protein S12 methylthiotransferase accessory factor
MEMLVTFEGGKKVDAHIAGHTIRTDQSVKEGGEGSAPEPFQYCLASIGTCAGVYVLAYLQARDLPVEGLKIVQTHVFDQKSHKLTDVKLDIQLPRAIPEKHHKAIIRSAQLCAVKKLFENPPEFDVTSSVQE